MSRVDDIGVHVVDRVAFAIRTDEAEAALYVFLWLVPFPLFFRDRPGDRVDDLVPVIPDADPNVLLFMPGPLNLHALGRGVFIRTTRKLVGVGYLAVPALVLRRSVTLEPRESPQAIVSQVLNKHLVTLYCGRLDRWGGRRCSVHRGESRRRLRPHRRPFAPQLLDVLDVLSGLGLAVLLTNTLHGLPRLLYKLLCKLPRG